MSLQNSAQLYYLTNRTEVFESDALHERALFCKLREQNIMTYLTLNEKARSFW